MSSGPFERSRRAGFTLLEVLVALVVAGLFLDVLGGAFATAWRSSRAPMELVSAASVARNALVAPDESLPRPGIAGGPSVARSIGAQTIVRLPSPVAPAPPDALAPEETPAPAGRPGLRHVGVVVTMPSGRTVRLDTVRLVPPGP